MFIRCPLAPLLALLTLTLHPAALFAQEPEPLSIGVFATVPAPGQPEGMAIGRDGNLYTGSAKAVGSTDPGTGKLFTLPVLPDGSPGALTLFWEAPLGIGALVAALALPGASAARRRRRPTC